MAELADRIEAGEFDGTLPYASFRKHPDEHAAYKQEKAEKAAALRDACIEHVRENIPSATPSQALLIFERAWREGHEDGLRRVFECQEELIELIQQMLGNA